MAALPIHLRAKRGRQTVFLVADPSDTVRLLKARLAEVNRVAAERIRIYAADEKTVYEDESTIGDHTLADNDVIYFVYKPDGGGDYEPIEVVPFGAEAEAADEEEEAKQ